MGRGCCSLASSGHVAVITDGDGNVVWRTNNGLGRVLVQPFDPTVGPTATLSRGYDAVQHQVIHGRSTIPTTTAHNKHRERAISTWPPNPGIRRWCRTGQGSSR